MNKDRIELILDLYKKKFFWEKRALLNALIASLTVDEVCFLFDLRHSFDLRRATLRKIANDMRLSFCDVHESLIARLIASYGSLPYAQKRKCIHALGFLQPFMPEDVGDNVS